MRALSPLLLLELAADEAAGGRAAATKLPVPAATPPAVGVGDEGGLDEAGGESNGLALSPAKRLASAAVVAAVAAEVVGAPGAAAGWIEGGKSSLGDAQ